MIFDKMIFARQTESFYFCYACAKNITSSVIPARLFAIRMNIIKKYIYPLPPPHTNYTTSVIIVRKTYIISPSYTQPNNKQKPNSVIPVKTGIQKDFRKHKSFMRETEVLECVFYFLS
ncbi:MAG: hypothetical protein LBP40_07880 [Campylobacteraceae bacterium]|nr:hypothetical protein [Campylobacteraceae bacterium]